MIIARVNEYKINEKDYNKELDWIMQELHLEESNEKIQYQAINKLIDAILILTEARKSDLEVSSEEIESGLIDLKVKYASEEDFEKMLSSMDTTIEKIRKRITDKKLIKKYIDMNIRLENPQISDEQLNQIYSKNKKLFMQEESVHAHHLLIEDETEKGKQRAEFIWNNLTSADDFLNLEQLSTKSELDFFGGDLGFFEKGKMVPEFDEVVFKMKEGEISKPLLTEFGWHIIYLEEKRNARIPDFDEVKQLIRQRLVNIDKELKIIKHIKLLRSKADIEIFEENLG